MPCNMMSDANAGDFAQAAVHRLERRVAELEQILFDYCQFLQANAATNYGENIRVTLPPLLDAWFEKHKRQLGCTAGEKL